MSAVKRRNQINEHPYAKVSNAMTTNHPQVSQNRSVGHCVIRM